VIVSTNFLFIFLEGKDRMGFIQSQVPDDLSNAANTALLAGDEDALVQAAIHEPAAFAQLYRRYVDRVYRYLLIKVGNVEDAQDLTAQTFLAAMENIRQYQRQSAFGGWLIGIAQNKANDHFRRLKEDISLDQIADILPADFSLDEIVDHRIQVSDILAALQELSPDRAEALTLRLFSELSAAEIGRLLGKSEAAAKMLVHRAFQDLRARLGNVDEVQS
jgi:RNA polymerase sigma-70 factor (ECF subfamily)